MNEKQQKIGNLFLEAARKKLQAEIEDSKAKIHMYVNSPLGVAEHPNITDEILKAAEQGAHARDVLMFLGNCEFYTEQN